MFWWAILLISRINRQYTSCRALLLSFHSLERFVSIGFYYISRSQNPSQSILPKNLNRATRIFCVSLNSFHLPERLAQYRVVRLLGHAALPRRVERAQVVADDRDETAMEGENDWGGIVGLSRFFNAPMSHLFSQLSHPIVFICSIYRAFYKAKEWNIASVQVCRFTSFILKRKSMCDCQF